MKKLITACFLAWALPLFAQKKPFEIKGEISNSQIKQVYLSYQSKREIDSAIVVDRKFRFTGETEGIESISLKVGDMRYPTVLTPGKLRVCFPNEKITEVEVSGQQPAIDFRSCLLVVTPFLDQVKTIGSKYQEAVEKRDTATMLVLGKQNDQTYVDRITAVKQWTENHLNSMMSPYIMQTELKSLSVDELEKLYHRLSSLVQKSKGGKDLFVLIKSKKAVRIGQDAPVFHQQTNKGLSFSLESAKDNYILLNFWASWCAPCRLENPVLVSLYDRFKNKNFKIISISLDEYKNSWLNAIEEDHLVWEQLSDLKGWKNEVALSYGIGALPAIFLLDPQLKIIAINPDMGTLTKTIEKLLK